MTPIGALHSASKRKSFTAQNCAAALPQVSVCEVQCTATVTVGAHSALPQWRPVFVVSLDFVQCVSCGASDWLAEKPGLVERVQRDANLQRGITTEFSRAEASSVFLSSRGVQVKLCSIEVQRICAGPFERSQSAS